METFFESQKIEKRKEKGRKILGEREGFLFDLFSIYHAPSPSSLALYLRSPLMEPQHQLHAIDVPAASSPPSDDHRGEDHHPNFSPVGSTEVDESCIPQPLDGNQACVLPDDLRRKIINQVEYYLSDENLPNDKFLMSYISKNAEGYVPIGVIASFRKMKKLTRDTSLVADALKESSLLVVSSNGAKVKRLNPLPLEDLKDPMVCTVLVENLPEDHSIENLQRMFAEAGNIKHITIHQPHDAIDKKKCTAAEKIISGRLHALVEYDTVEAAEKAVLTLNNEQDWRYGLRVKLLKKLKKPGQKKQAWRDSQPEKSSKAQPSEHSGNEESIEHHDDSPHDEEDADHQSKEKNGADIAKEKNGPKGRNRGRGRRQKYCGANGHGTQSSNHGPEPSKPPPGPRMPDGTRGFTMGRGRPLATG